MELIHELAGTQLHVPLQTIYGSSFNISTSIELHFRGESTNINIADFIIVIPFKQNQS